MRFDNSNVLLGLFGIKFQNPQKIILVQTIENSLLEIDIFYDTVSIGFLSLSYMLVSYCEKHNISKKIREDIQYLVCKLHMN